MPARSRRSRIHCGVSAAGLRLRITRPVKRPQRSGASITTGLTHSHVAGTGSMAGMTSGAPVAAWRSRATPVTESASPRFGVSLISILESSSLAYSRMSVPIGASSGRIQMPLCSSLMPSSRAEQSMPMDTTPRSLDFLILKSPGRTAPIVAQATLMPARTFGAPQTIWSVSPVPAFTSQTCRWSEFS